MLSHPMRDLHDRSRAPLRRPPKCCDLKPVSAGEGELFSAHFNSAVTEYVMDWQKMSRFRALGRIWGSNCLKRLEFADVFNGGRESFWAKSYASILQTFVDPMFLTDINANSRKRPKSEFPWSMKLFRGLKELHFTAPVTFFVGENGSGKSTLLEAIAIGVNAIAAGSADLNHDETLWASHELARGFHFARARHPKRTMFLRAEDVMGYSMRAARLRREGDFLREYGSKALEQLGEEGIGDQTKPRADTPARMKERLLRRHAWDPGDRSHGETFLDLLGDRVRAGGLYLLDEPETPLSPVRQLSLLGLVKERAAEDCQFIVATHSPILMALPEAQILSFDNGRIQPVAYDDVEHVKITKSFLNNPAKFLRHF
jgi:predicted ATPase